MRVAKGPTIKIPTVYRRYRRLVAIPETTFTSVHRYLDEQQALSQIAEAEHDLATGNYVIANSLDAALEAFDA